MRRKPRLASTTRSSSRWALVSVQRPPERPSVANACTRQVNAGAVLRHPVRLDLLGRDEHADAHGDQHHHPQGVGHRAPAWRTPPHQGGRAECGPHCRGARAARGRGLPPGGRAGRGPDDRVGGRRPTPGSSSAGSRRRWSRSRSRARRSKGCGGGASCSSSTPTARCSGLRFGMTGRLIVDGLAAVDQLEYSLDPRRAGVGPLRARLRRRGIPSPERPPPARRRRARPRRGGAGPRRARDHTGPAGCRARREPVGAQGTAPGPDARGGRGQPPRRRDALAGRARPGAPGRRPRRQRAAAPPPGAAPHARPARRAGRIAPGRPPAGPPAGWDLPPRRHPAGAAYDRGPHHLLVSRAPALSRYGAPPATVVERSLPRRFQARVRNWYVMRLAPCLAVALATAVGGGALLAAPAGAATPLVAGAPLVAEAAAATTVPGVPTIPTTVPLPTQSTSLTPVVRAAHHGACHQRRQGHGAGQPGGGGAHRPGRADRPADLLVLAVDQARAAVARGRRADEHPQVAARQARQARPGCWRSTTPSGAPYRRSRSPG